MVLKNICRNYKATTHLINCHTFFLTLSFSGKTQEKRAFLYKKQQNKLKKLFHINTPKSTLCFVILNEEYRPTLLLSAHGWHWVEKLLVFRFFILFLTFNTVAINYEYGKITVRRETAGIKTGEGTLSIFVLSPPTGHNISDTQNITRYANIML